MWWIGVPTTGPNNHMGDMYPDIFQPIHASQSQIVETPLLPMNFLTMDPLFNNDKTRS